MLNIAKETAGKKQDLKKDFWYIFRQICVMVLTPKQINGLLKSIRGTQDLTKHNEQLSKRPNNKDMPGAEAGSVVQQSV